MSKSFILGIILAVFMASLLSCAKEPGQETLEAPEGPEEVATDLVSDSAAPDDLAGALFGVPVPLSNYYFAKTAVVGFSATWRSSPKNEEELEDLVWQELVLSFEAFRRGIEATQEEKEREIDKILKAEKVDFNWKEDAQAYSDWLAGKLKTSPLFFEGMIEHLVKLHKLRQQVLDSIEPEVTDQEAYQKFLDEYNTLSVELRRFDDLKEAQGFYEQIDKDPRAWEQRKEKEPEEFKRPGAVALDFLINLWGFDRDAAYAMIEAKEGTFYKPASIYKGYAVFKILKVRKANIGDYDEKKKERYLKRVANIKKHKGFKEWKDKFKEAADIEVYLESHKSPFTGVQDTSKDVESSEAQVTSHTKEEADG